MALKKASRTTLTGIVIPVDWNEDQDVVAVALAMADETECRVGANRKGRELLGCLQRQVEATGTVRRDEQGRAVITVSHYVIK